MPRIHNWEEWDDVEDKAQNEMIREKIVHKIKSQNKKEQNEKPNQNKKQPNISNLRQQEINKPSGIYYFCQSPCVHSANICTYWPPESL